MINYENKSIHDNLRKLEKRNYRNGIFVLVIMAVIVIIGYNNIAQLSEQSQNERIEHISDNKSLADNKGEDKSITKEKRIDILIAVNIPLLILMLYFFIKGYSYGKEADKYCPYCYTKNFTTTTLNKTKIRSYTKKETFKDSNGREKIKRVLYEDWEGEYRNECCGTKYHKTWQNKIDLG